MYDSDNYRYSKKVEIWGWKKIQKNIYECTSYILAGAKIGCAAGRLNCYEFGVKFDFSLDSEGYGRIEKVSFEAYNESMSVIEAIEHFKENTGYYPKPVLTDQIYRRSEQTGVIARSMESAYQIQSWADQVQQHKLIKSKRIRIIQIESKWNVF